MRRTLAPTFLLAAVSVPALAPAQVGSFPLDPRATFLRTNQDQPQPPLVLDLGAAGVLPGQWLRVGVTGAYRYINGGADTYYSLMGVFSSSPQLLASSQQHRVPGAIGAGPAAASGGTYYGSLPMDIPQDFVAARNTWATSVDVPVPAGATHLFLGTHDSWYQDNVDPNGDFRAVVTVIPTPALPGTGEHLVLRTGVGGGAATATPETKPAPGGAALTVELAQPLGGFDTNLWLIAMNVVATGSTPLPFLPNVWGTNPVVAAAGVVPGTATAGLWNGSAPSGFAGWTLLVQGGGLGGISRNGIYETTNAHRFVLQ